MFWIATLGVCTLVSCSIPSPSHSPAFSLYATKEACEQGVAIADKPNGFEWKCIAADTVTFSPKMGFDTGAIMVKP